MAHSSVDFRFRSLPFLITFGLCLTLLLSGCDSSDTGTDPARTESADATEEPLSGDLKDAEIQAQLQGSTSSGEESPGALLYARDCASCHDTKVVRAPARNLLQLLTPEAILGSLESGVMAQQGAKLSDQEKRQVVEYLVGTSRSEPVVLKRCEADEDWFDWAQRPFADGWGLDYANTRRVPDASGGLSADQLPRLELKWVFDYPRASRARSHPSFAGGGLYVGSQTGTVYALDQATGCVRWTYEAGAEVRTGISIADWAGQDEPRAVGYFADLLARTHAVDLTTGKGLWKTAVDDHPNATGTAQPVVFENRVFQPVSSLEVVPAADPAYSCCSFRGAIVTLAADTGDIVRTTYTIPEEPSQVATNNVGTPVLAPSGAPVWNTPALDVEKRRLYFGTGENYSSPADGNSDAIIAMDIDSGDILWVTQTTAGDAWNVACMVFIENKTNCPVEEGPDLDFGAPPILVSWEGRRILVAGQKSGEVFGINPDSGEIIWRSKLGRGGVQGGIHFGMAADGRTVFVPMSDYTDASLSEEDARPGIFAVDAFTGDLQWSHLADNVCGDREDCDPGISAAISAISGATVAGHMDGRLRAYAADDGRVLWEVETDRTFTGLSGNEARGGSFGGGTAPVAYRGMLYANSGYGLYFHRPGNVLLAFGPRQNSGP